MNLTSVLQKIICLQYGVEYKKLVNSLEHVESVQEFNLKQILEYLRPFHKNLEYIQSYEDFAEQIPITQYSHWKAGIDEMRNNQTHPFRHVCSRFEPTSGSTNAVKWIPYSKGFLMEINRAASAWLYDTFKEYPSVLKGRHYWSLSWVPPELRNTHNSNDVELFPFWQRSFLSQIMAVPDVVKSAKTQEACWFASLVYLVACRDLSLMSIWSPTFLLQVVKDIYKYRHLIASSLKQGAWSLYADDLFGIPCPISFEQAEALELPLSHDRFEPNSDFVQRIWPHLALLSCWDSSTAGVWISELKKFFPKVPIQGKGLWATEGVVTFPFQGQRVLSVRSHFYEFRCLDSHKILRAWQLKQGMFVQPIISSRSGLLRYELPDKMRVSGSIGAAPCLDFVNRINSIDLVGEKIDFDTAQGIIQDINQHFGVRGLCLIAEKNSQPKPKYKLLLDGETTFSQSLREAIEDYVEGRLCDHYHYKLSRNLGQLGSCEVLVVEDSLQILKKFQKASIGGSNKIEPIVILESPL